MRWFIRFFDELEDSVRFWLSRYPILYAFLAGIGTVFFFRGVWMITDDLPFMTGWVTLGAGMFLMLITGSLVFHFIGDGLLLSGMRRKKKVSEKVARQLRSQRVAGKKKRQ